MGGAESKSEDGSKRGDTQPHPLPVAENSRNVPRRKAGVQVSTQDSGLHHGVADSSEGYNCVGLEADMVMRPSSIDGSVNIRDEEAVHGSAIRLSPTNTEAQHAQLQDVEVVVGGANAPRSFDAETSLVNPVLYQHLGIHQCSRDPVGAMSPAYVDQMPSSQPGPEMRLHHGVHAPSAPGSHPPGAGQASRDTLVVTIPRTHDPVPDGISPWRSRVEMVLKLAIFVGIIVGAVFGGQAWQNYISYFRNALQVVPLWGGCGGFCVLHFVRKMFPPLYFAFPIMGLTQIYLADRMGPLYGAAILQALKLQDVLHFVLMRRYYTPFADALLETDVANVQQGSRLRKYMPAVLRQMLGVMDSGWGSRVQEGSWQKQGFLVWAFGLSLFMDDFVNVFWWSTRSAVRLAVFAPSFIFAMLCEVPKTHIAMIAVIATLDTVQNAGGVADFVSAMQQVPLFEVLLLAITAGSATFIVQATNLRIIFEAIMARLCPVTWAAIKRRFGVQEIQLSRVRSTSGNPRMSYTRSFDAAPLANTLHSDGSAQPRSPHHFALTTPMAVSPALRMISSPPGLLQKVDSWNLSRQQLWHNTGTDELARIVGLSGEDFANAWSTFQELDLDRDGSLNRHDIAAAMGEDVKEPRVGLAMNALDIDGSGAVDFKAFTIALCHLRAEELNMEEMARFCFPMACARNPGMDEDMFASLVGTHPERFEGVLSLRTHLQNIFVGAFNAACAVRDGRANRQLGLGSMKSNMDSKGGWGAKRGSTMLFPLAYSQAGGLGEVPGGPASPRLPKSGMDGQGEGSCGGKFGGGGEEGEWPRRGRSRTETRAECFERMKEERRRRSGSDSQQGHEQDDAPSLEEEYLRGDARDNPFHGAAGSDEEEQISRSPPDAVEDDEAIQLDGLSENEKRVLSDISELKARLNELEQGLRPSSRGPRSGGGAA